MPSRLVIDSIPTSPISCEALRPSLRALGGVVLEELKNTAEVFNDNDERARVAARLNDLIPEVGRILTQSETTE